MLVLKCRIFLSHRYMKYHQHHKLNATPNLDYFGHHINVYHLIPHVGSGWNIILKGAPRIKNWMTHNTGQVMWNDWLNDIGKLKLDLRLRTLFCI